MHERDKNFLHILQEQIETHRKTKTKHNYMNIHIHTTIYTHVYIQIFICSICTVFIHPFLQWLDPLLFHVGGGHASYHTVNECVRGHNKSKIVLHTAQRCHLHSKQRKNKTVKKQAKFCS